MNGSDSRLGVYEARICLDLPLPASPRTTNAWAHLPSCVPPSLPAPGSLGAARRRRPSPGLGWARARWYRNVYRLCIDYAFRPRLSSRLTLGGLAFPRNPWAFGGGVSHPSLATHASIRSRARSTTVPTAASPHARRSPTTPEGVRNFGSSLEPRYIVRAGPLDQ